jgi:periplasmic copper chaperone A
MEIFMKHVCTVALGAALFCLAGSSAALAHATLETKEAPASSFYKAVIRIGHGCEGTATTSIRVQIPEGVIAVKPMPKPGWELITKEGQYAQAYDYYDEKLTKGVTEVSWTGGSLPDAWYDEFVFRARLPDRPPGTVIHFPIVQQCEKGVHRWIEIPEPGKTADDYMEPAPGVTLTAKP